VGTSSAFYNGSISVATCQVDPNADAIGWYAGNWTATKQPVGQKIPNPWGLYDMAGNAFEWVNDWYQEKLGTSAVTDPWGPSGGGTILVKGVGPCD
jgi:formylglycine-generating enzyme required for sulfatase activity